ncbi:MAG: folylpolyglutamate synthase/dihydrofolate synthase family protein [Actinomycetaceae bacterium]|nr:folylpolyglutamate synthase/dihydrofolate synthase family protein [Actinomycetaceae bacterium]
MNRDDFEPEVELEDALDPLDIVEQDVSEDLGRVLAEIRMSEPSAGEETDDDETDVPPLEDGVLAMSEPSGSMGEPSDVGARYEQIEAAILSRAPEHKVQPSLERVQMALNILGDPQNTYRSVHITGTNGKTSTARMVSALLRASGRKVGRFTSPHLTSMRERISINDEPISVENFVTAFDDVAPYLDMVDAHSARHDNPRMSFFEILTVTALSYFADLPVDAAVIEVGMGGTWDATNTISADVAVIAPISIDHERWLGHSLIEIATEKAGIIKPGAIVISAAQEPEVLDIIRSRAREVGAIVRVLGEDIRLIDRQLGVGGQLVTISTPAAQYSDIFVPLLGAHQADNAALALAAMEAFNGGRALDPVIVEEGFASTTSPGRLEIVRSSPSIVVDSAHNTHGASALARALTDSFDYTHIVGVYSAMADKNVEAVLAELEPVLEEVVVTTMNSPRAMELSELEAIARDVFGEDRVRAERKLIDAVDTAVELSESHGDPAASNGVVIFGSVVLAGQARDLIGE